MAAIHAVPNVLYCINEKTNAANKTINDYSICIIVHVISYEQLKWPSGKSVRLGSCRLGFNSKSGHTNDVKIGIHSFPA